MKFVRYTKYTGEPSDAIDLEDLVQKLSDFFLQSGFDSPYGNFQELDATRTMEDLREAILRALESGELLPPETLEKMMEDPDYEKQLQKLIDQIIERMEQEGYVSQHPPQVTPPPGKAQLGSVGDAHQHANVRFEITDKTLDFLGYKALKDLMGSFGKSSFGRHDTRALSTGIETGGASKPYEFGDTLNLDIPATLFSAVRRNGPTLPLPIDYSDLMVHQCDYQSSCATVLLLDCSHSMILYGEDRFTPAKRVSLALSHLIRTQYPGDSLHLVLFHDSAEELPLADLARVQVGPFYTNTREGLRLARRILTRQKKDMRQIIMITDGKPSALTLEDGRIYKNAFGLDPMVVSQTLEEVARCKRAGILINTFMLASDYSLVQFVQKVAQMCRGKAYFTTPQTLGQYLLMDFMDKKVRRVH